MWRKELLPTVCRDYHSFIIRKSKSKPGYDVWEMCYLQVYTWCFVFDFIGRYIPYLFVEYLISHVFIIIVEIIYVLSSLSQNMLIGTIVMIYPFFHFKSHQEILFRISFAMCNGDHQTLHRRNIVPGYMESPQWKPFHLVCIMHSCWS